MATRTKEDPLLRAIREKLEKEYASEHRRAKIKAYRYNSVSVRVRIIDPDFAGLSRAQRDSAVWDILDTLPEDVRADVSMLLLLTPEEAKGSIMNREFDDPTPSRL